MLAITIRKRNVTRTVYVPCYKFSSDTPETLKEREERETASYPARNFRFYNDRTVFERGNLRIVFGLEGYAVEGYSYDACLFAFAPPCEDFPRGRMIWNDTTYSVTTNSKHRYTLLEFAQGPVTSERLVTEGNGEGERYTYLSRVHAQWEQRCEVAHMPWRCSPSALQNEIRNWYWAARAGEAAKEHNVSVREQRARARRDKIISQGKHLKLVGGM